MIAREAITGLMLCGGAGRRMGGVDKPLQPWRGRPLVGHVIDRVTPACGPLLISANRSLAQYAALGHPVITDRIPDAGPLGGLHAAAAHLTTACVFVCAGDMPLIDPRIVERLAAALDSDAGVMAAVAHDGEALQPLVMLLRRDALSSLDGYLASGQRAVHRWVETLSTTIVDAADLAAAFRNMNTPGDLATD